MITKSQVTASLQSEKVGLEHKSSLLPPLLLRNPRLLTVGLQLARLLDLIVREPTRVLLPVLALRSRSERRDEKHHD